MKAKRISSIVLVPVLCLLLIWTGLGRSYYGYAAEETEAEETPASEAVAEPTTEKAEAEETPVSEDTAQSEEEKLTDAGAQESDAAAGPASEKETLPESEQTDQADGFAPFAVKNETPKRDEAMTRDARCNG